MVVMSVSIGISIWVSVSSLNCVVVISMWVIVEICAMWELIMMWVDLSVLNLMVLNSVMELTLNIMEKLIIGVLNVMDHSGSSMVVTVMVVKISMVCGWIMKV